MKRLAVEQLVFTFTDEWDVSKYDEWTFYRNQFQAACGGGVKAVDLIALDSDKTAWLIEVKDYRRYRRTKVIDLANEVADKVFDSLAGLLPAQTRSDELSEAAFARNADKARNLRVVLHLEQPRQTSKLFPRAISIPDLQLKLRSLVKSIDAHPVVCDRADLSRVRWVVR